jgi:hypothetical protein
MECWVSRDWGHCPISQRGAQRWLHVSGHAAWLPPWEERRLRAAQLVLVLFGSCGRAGNDKELDTTC